MGAEFEVHRCDAMPRSQRVCVYRMYSRGPWAFSFDVGNYYAHADLRYEGVTHCPFCGDLLDKEGE